YDGLARFDGMRFLRVGPDEPAHLEGNRIHCLFLDSSQQLWAGTDGAGVFRYTADGFKWFSDRAGSSVNAVRSIVPDDAGNLWLGTQGGLGRLIGDRMTWFNET